MTRYTLADEGRNMTPAEMDRLLAGYEPAPEWPALTPEEEAREAHEAALLADLDPEEIDALNSWDAVLAERLAPAVAPKAPEPVVAKVVEEDEWKLFARTIIDEIDETFSPEDTARVEAILAKQAEIDAAEAAAAEEDAGNGGEVEEKTTLSAMMAERASAAAVEEATEAAAVVAGELVPAVPLTAEETDRRQKAVARKAEANAESAKALEVLSSNPAWGLQRPFLIDDEIVAKLVTMGDTYYSGLERLQLLLRDRVSFRDSGEAMIWTDTRVWIDNPRFENELQKLLYAVIRAIKLIEIPARLEAVTESGDYKLAEMDLQSAKTSGDSKKVAEIEKAMADLERKAVGGVEKMWRRMEDMSPGSLVRDAIAYLRSECHVPDAYWLAGGGKLNFADWTVDVFSGEKWEHRREDYLTHMIDLNYDDVVGARNEDVDSIFARIPEEDQPGVKGLLRRYFGSMLTGSVNHKCFLYLWGENNSGKSTIVKAAESAIATNPTYGRGANVIHSAGPEAFQKMSGDASKSIPRHQLRGRRGVWVDEAQGVNYDPDFLNRMTNPAGDIESQPLFAKKGERVLWTPEASIVLVGNRAGGIPMQEGVQRRMLVVKSGARLADGDNDVTAADGAEKADVGIINRLKTPEAREAMLWQMILGARELGPVGDRGEMEGECASWLNEGRLANAEDVVDARAIWLRDFAQVVEEGEESSEEFYTLQEAFVEVQAINAGYLRSNNAFDRVTDKMLSEFLATKGFKKAQVRRDGKRVYGYIRLRRRPLDRIPTELQQFSTYAAGMEGEILGRSRSGGAITLPKDANFSSLPREELEAMLASMVAERAR
ncbi:hypothetical protein [Kocuria rosea]|uniref:SF3 helicase domain-containing protein n=1 Tax=Kocuria rosea TaxID=1275 RepID=A0A4R5YGK2_KOCRO|nr:hypothetical protein [Kocuria rosea]TDL42486.1 hypothetical protein E2R59_11105 [Kocuria rosea]